MIGRRGHLLAALAAGLALAGCATSPARQPPAAATGGDEVFGLVGPETPARLKRVAEAPYATPDPRTCEEVERQIAELDSLLGPDIDTAARGDDNLVGEWAKGALRGLVPYRGVVRFLTGASRKEKAMAAALLAGAARRGYLKGMRETLPCPPIGAAAAP